MTAPRKRPAHRPSRRGAVVQAAMALFAQPSGDTVMVADIAEAAGMTSAAVYYHFASKDDILVEGLRIIGRALVDRAEQLAGKVTTEPGSVGELPVQLLGWFDERRAEATVWFVTSAGVSLAAEQVRRELRGELLLVLLGAVKASRPRMAAAQGAVVATALLCLIETAASSWLTDDESMSVLGRRRFLQETAALAERIAGAP